jgi:hypothetical protein
MSSFLFQDKERKFLKFKNPLDEKESAAKPCRPQAKD